MNNSKIFIIEDEFIIVEDIKTILLKLGYMIAGVSYNGENLADEIIKTNPDLILIDIMLKANFDGIELAEKLKKQFDIPIIFMTALTDETTLRRAKITEPMGYIIKPFDEKELYVTIEIALYKDSANKEIKKKQKMLQLLSEFNEKITTLSRSEIIKNSMLFIKNKMNFDHILISLKEKEKDNALSYKLLNYSIPGLEDGYFYPYSKMIKKKVMEQMTPHYRPNIEEDNIGEMDKLLLDEGIKSSFSIPLIIGKSCIGTLNVSTKKTDGISSYDRDILLMLAPRLALSIQNSIIFDDLARSEERFRTFTNFLPQLIAEIKFNGKIVFVNNAAYTAFGYSREDVKKGLFIFDLVAPEDLERIKTDIQKLYDGEKITDIEYRAKKKDGTVIPIIINTNIIYEKNLPIGILALIVDVSELKKIEESLAKEKELLTVTLRSIEDGVITTDVNGNIVLINEIAEILTGWTFDDVIGKNIENVFNISYKRKKSPTESVIGEIIHSGISFTSNENIILYAKDGHEKIIEVKTNILRDTDNKAMGTVVVFRDITVKNRMQEEMVKIKKLESLGVLAGGIAHDFNNILTAILGNITLAKLYSDESDKIYEILCEAEKATLRSKDLTQQLITFSKGGLPVKEVGQIKNLIIESASFILRGANVKCNFEFHEDLWIIEMDIGQINQVINNLIINASQAMDNGGIINIKGENFVLKEDNVLPIKKGNYVKISFQDSGVGISKENLQKIFDPYFTTKSTGNGLGLAITYSIINKHNGYISVNSIVGEGTTFTLYLPATFSKEDSASQHTTYLSTQKAKILLMDDEEIIREVGYKILMHLGYDVTVASDGNEVIELYNSSLEKEPFDLVIIDLTVPGGMGGKEVIKKLIEINPEIKAIVSSGYTTDPVISNFKEYGFKSVILKPYKIENISSILIDVMNDNT